MSSRTCCSSQPAGNALDFIVSPPALLLRRPPRFLLLPPSPLGLQRDLDGAAGSEVVGQPGESARGPPPHRRGKLGVGGGLDLVLLEDARLRRRELDAGQE